MTAFHEDVVVIGGGVTGCAIARELSRYELRTVVLEKEEDVCSGTSKANSAIVHAGFDAVPGTMKARFNVEGNRMMGQLSEDLDFEFKRNGSMVLCFDEADRPALQALYERGLANGLERVKYITSDEIKETEPYVTGIKGIFVPQTGITDYKEVSRKIAEIISHRGAEIKFNEEVQSLMIDGNETEVITKKNKYTSKVLVACAGLYSDKIAAMTKDKIEFRIIPFRGEYYRLKDSAKHLVKNLIYPVPDPEFPFLGVHFTRRVDGMTEAGPNAVLAFKKEGYEKSDIDFREFAGTLAYKGFQKVAAKFWKTGFYEFRRSFSKREFVRSLQKLIPSIKENDIEKGGSGVRAQACDFKGNLIDDFLFVENERVINVCNAPSPAATSAFSIGNTISKKVFLKIN